MGHEEAVSPYRYRRPPRRTSGVRFRAALGALALLAALVGGGGWLLERQAGLHPARALAGGAAGSGAPSGAWYCPHGGGAGWTAGLAITNPGDGAVAVRVQSMSAAGPGEP